MCLSRRQRLASDLLEINEALCSSCTVKPEKFQAKQENMMASMRKRGLLSTSFMYGFLRPLNEEVDTVPRVLH